MLSADARKTLAAIWRNHRHEWADYRRDIPDMARRSGRPEERVRAALNELLKAGYIEYANGLARVIWPSELERMQQARRNWEDRK